MPEATVNLAGTAPMTFKAGGAITANRAVKLDASGDVVVTTAESDNVIGIALNTVASGEYVDVLTVNGVKAKVTASAAIAIGAQVEPAADGKCATAGGAAAKSFGIALSAAAADGEIIEVLTRFGVNIPANS